MASQESSTPARPPAPRPPFIAMVLYYGTYLLIFGMIGLTLFLTWPGIVATFQARIAGAPGIVQPTQINNVGGQAPPSVRGTNPDPVVPPAPRATPIPGIAQSEAEGVRIYQTTIAAQQQAAPAVSTPIPPPLPQNSAGAPVIDQVQQAQLDQSAQMAADDAQAAQRQAQLADAAQRAPDMSYADAAAMLHRDPCHVPRADPATCGLGLFKPTPIGGSDGH